MSELDKTVENVIKYSNPETTQRYLVLVKAQEGHVCLPINLDDDFLGMQDMIPSLVKGGELWACVSAKDPADANSKASQLFKSAN